MRPIWKRFSINSEGRVTQDRLRRAKTWLEAEIAGAFCYDKPDPKALCFDGTWNWPMTLREILEKYVKAAGGYGKTVPLSSLGLSREEIERTFGLFDEDYHISRYFHFQCAAGANYQINGFPQTHLSIDAEIQTVL